jgi:hypothetical protein
MYTVANITGFIAFAASALTVGWSVWNSARPASAKEEQKKEIVHKSEVKSVELV